MTAHQLAPPGSRPARGFRLTGAFLLTVALVIIVFPLAWIAFGAFRNPADLTDPGSFAIHPTLDNFSKISDADVPGAATRSAILGIVVAVLAVGAGSLAAYSIARFRTGGDLFRVGILLPTVIPPTVLAFPLLALALSLKLNDSLLSVVAAHLTYVVPLVTWFMVGFFKAVPRELEEQAAIDGFGEFAAFRLVVLPNVLPGIGAAALLAFMLSWNEFFYALMLAPGTSRTLPVAIAGFNTFQGVQLGPLSAAVIVSAVPVVVLSFVVQRYLVRGGGTASGVKQ
jgi:ABC-type glycerol-3-phosphate transport system permease component